MSDARVVWKYPLAITDEAVVSIPAPAKVLHIGHDPGGTICAWVEVDPAAPTVETTFRVRGTGHPFAPDHTERFFGTINDGPFMWHVWLVQQ